MADQEPALTSGAGGGVVVDTAGTGAGCLEELLAVGDPFARLVQKYLVVEGIEWYQRAKRWRRRAYRATLAAGGLVSVVLVGLSLLAGSETSDRRFQVPTGVSGVAVGGLTWVMGTTDFRRQWQVFTDAQTEMEYDLAEWELAMADAAASASGEEAHRVKRDATSEALRKARTIRRREQHAFFGNARPDPGPQALGALEDHTRTA